MAKKVSKNKSTLEESTTGAQQVASPVTTTPKSKGAAKSKLPPPPSPPIDVDELPDSSDETDAEEAEAENVNEASIGWPKEDDLVLFSRIRAVCPKEDHLKYDTRVNQIDWQKVKFGVYSEEDCKTRWEYVMSRLRHFRVLGEVLTDAVTWRNEYPWYNFNKGGKSSLKHPDLPKKPLSSYMLFYMDQKHTVAQANPGSTMTELSKHVAKMYNGLSEKKKQKYIRLAEEKKIEYNKEMAKFLETHPDYKPIARSGAKAVPPKLPTPFKLYSDVTMPKFLKNGLSPTEARNECSRTYKELNEIMKIKWIKMALEQEPSYYEKMAAFKIEHPKFAVTAKKVVLLTKEEIQIKDKFNGKPEKPPNSGYSIFSKELLSSDRLKNFESKDRMTEISRAWKELGEEDKAEFNERAQALNHQYKMKYSVYIESLTPEQRNIELHSALVKGMKRPRTKKTNEEGDVKKLKKSDDSDSIDDDREDEGEEEEEGDDDFEAPKKSAIQKPNSSLHKFCEVNEQKYRAKFPKISGQELTRHMAKEFSKLSSEQKKKYDLMAQKSKNDSSASASKSPSKKTVKSKANVSSSTSVVSQSGSSKKNPAVVTSPTSSPKKNLAVVASATLSPASKPGPASKKAAAKSAPAANGSTPKATTKTATSKQSPKSKQQQVPEWAEKFSEALPGEPLKPLENVMAYYAGTKKMSNLSQAEMEKMWASISSKQQKKIIAEHKKKLVEYSGTFEAFARTLAPSDLVKLKKVVSERKQTNNQEDSDESDEDGSDSEEKDEETSSEEEDSD